MLIKENGFYLLSNLNSWKIEIWDWVVATFFDDWHSDIDVCIWEWSNIEFYWFLKGDNIHNINFYQNSNSSKLKVNYLLVSYDSSEIKSKIYSKILSNSSNVDIHILSLVWNEWIIDIDWIVEIDKWFHKIKWHLLEENIFLWSKWKIRWVPTLLVRSDDVEASHACKIEKINDEELFYLRSRWLKKSDSVSMLIESKIKILFSCLSMIDKSFYWELLEEILEITNNKLTNK